MKGEQFNEQKAELFKWIWSNSQLWAAVHIHTKKWFPVFGELLTSFIYERHFLRSHTLKALLFSNVFTFLIMTGLSFRWIWRWPFIFLALFAIQEIWFLQKFPSFPVLLSELAHFSNVSLFFPFLYLSSISPPLPLYGHGLYFSFSGFSPLQLSSQNLFARMELRLIYIMYPITCCKPQIYTIKFILKKT